MACARPEGERAVKDVGPVSAYARNELAAKNPEGLLRVAEGFERSGDAAGAHALYAQALAALPETGQAHTEATIGFARTAAAIGKSDQAVAILTQSLHSIPIIDPLRDRAVRALIDIHTTEGRYGAALQHVSDLSLPRATDKANKARLMQTLGQSEAARALLNELVDEAPNDPAVLRMSALSFALDGDYAAGVALLSPLFSIPGANAAAQQSLADIYAVSGQRQAALSIVRDGLPPQQLQRLEFFYRILPELNREEQAGYLFFGRVPDSLIEALSKAAKADAPN